MKMTSVDWWVSMRSNAGRIDGSGNYAHGEQADIEMQISSSVGHNFQGLNGVEEDDTESKCKYLV